MSKHQIQQAETNLNSPNTFTCSCGSGGKGIAPGEIQFLEHVAVEAIEALIAEHNAAVTARAALAADCRKPRTDQKEPQMLIIDEVMEYEPTPEPRRTITTIEELDALPMDTVIRDDDEYVWERWSLFAKTTNWRCAGAPDLVDDEVALPAIVIWEPKA